ncbi:formate dehydrogenase accessory sulfurtransferase FdhD [Vibrio variabilis]|uniref:formate dehydrogenase accessory sulfurtransferase FdhD n=1 Tax=Vibrio variabilis TaxID=990271 RepID=UPI000DD50F94|nr:formate dehydrogenase accessory sulfurtransferase FdhD [Vibrio variabilis]
MKISLNFQNRSVVSNRVITKYLKSENYVFNNDSLIEEIPVAISYNGISYTTMMCTPCDLEHFAIGFSITEGIVDKRADIRDIEVVTEHQGTTIDVTISNQCTYRLKERKRSLAGTTGCGICGTERLKGILKVKLPVSNESKLNVSGLDLATKDLERKQYLSHRTGACHAAAYFSAEGHMLAIFVDVGRHIALDKLVGWYVQTNPTATGFVLVTSRASFEMVQKVAAVGIESLVAISAATELAVELAEKLNLTLVGYCRRGNATIYCHADRLILPQRESHDACFQ